MRWQRSVSCQLQLVDKAMFNTGFVRQLDSDLGAYWYTWGEDEQETVVVSADSDNCVAIPLVAKDIELACGREAKEDFLNHIDNLSDDDIE